MSETGVGGALVASGGRAGEALSTIRTTIDGAGAPIVDRRVRRRDDA